MGLGRAQPYNKLVVPQNARSAERARTNAAVPFCGAGGRSCAPRLLRSSQNYEARALSFPRQPRTLLTRLLSSVVCSCFRPVCVTRAWTLSRHVLKRLPPLPRRLICLRLFLPPRRSCLRHPAADSPGAHKYGQPRMSTSRHHQHGFDSCQCANAVALCQRRRS